MYQPKHPQWQETGFKILNRYLTEPLLFISPGHSGRGVAFSLTYCFPLVAGTFILLPLCRTYHWHSSVPRPLLGRGFHPALLQAAVGKVNHPWRHGECRPWVTSQSRLDAVSLASESFTGIFSVNVWDHCRLISAF